MEGFNAVAKDFIDTASQREVTYKRVNELERFQTRIATDHDQIKRLADDMQNTGYNEEFPIHVWKGQVVNGNHRWQAALVAGEKVIPTITIPEDYSKDVVRNIGVIENSRHPLVMPLRADDIKRHLRSEIRASDADTVKACIEDYMELFGKNKMSMAQFIANAEKFIDVEDSSFQYEPSIIETTRRELELKNRSAVVVMADAKDWKGKIGGGFLTSLRRSTETMIVRLFWSRYTTKESINSITGMVELALKDLEGLGMTIDFQVIKQHH